MDLGWPITPLQKRSVATPFLFFVVFQVEREAVITAWRLHWGLRELGQYRVICCLLCYFTCLIYLFSIFVIYLWHFILICLNNCGVIYCLLVNKSSHTLTCILHNITSILELCPFRRKCWLRSREIVISTMASQTLSEFMVLMTSWDCNLRTVIKKCSHSNRTLSVWTYNGWGSGCLTSPLGMTVRNDSGTF